MRRLGTAAVLTALVLGLVPSTTQAAAEDDPKITRKAVAALILEHIDSERTPGYVGPLDQKEPRAALVRYGVSGESPNPGRTIETTAGVLKKRPGFLDAGYCRRNPDLDGCRIRTLKDGSRLLLEWAEVEPEEDPGYVALFRFRGAEEPVSVVFFSGPSIKGDPAKKGLSNGIVSFAALKRIVKDPRLGLTTPQSLVDAGTAIPDWGVDLRP